MKSPGGSSTPPPMPTPQGNIVPYGQASTPQSPVMSFLPTDAGAMATGLTQDMVNQINRPSPLLTPQVTQSSGGPPVNENDLRAMIAKLMASNSGPRVPDTGRGSLGWQSGHGGR